MSEYIPEIIDNKYVIVKDYNKGIESKNKEFRDLAILYKEKDKEIERLNNIINEVREYITYWHYRNDFRPNSFTTGVKEELLKILDKGSDKE